MGQPSPNNSAGLGAADFSSGWLSSAPFGAERGRELENNASAAALLHQAEPGGARRTAVLSGPPEPEGPERPLIFNNEQVEVNLFILILKTRFYYSSQTSKFCFLAAWKGKKKI